MVFTVIINLIIFDELGPSHSEFRRPDLKPISPASRNLPVRLFASIYVLGGHVSQLPPIFIHRLWHSLPWGPFNVSSPPAWLCEVRYIILCCPSDFLLLFSPSQKGEHVLWCLTASSLRPLRLSSTTWRSCLRASYGRSAFGGTARRRMSGG